MQNVTEWQLFHLAKALTRAKRLEKQRADFHEELYETIICSSVSLDELNPQMMSSATDTQAIRIIEAKERYDRLIQSEYDRHVRWRQLLEWVGDNDRLIMIRYFEKKKSVQPKIINRLLSKIEKRLDQQEKRTEQERTEKSTADFRAYQEATKAFRKVREPTEELEDKQQYLINGRFVYMTPEEYETYAKEKANERERLYERLGL